ncbi:hypothetical protein [Allofournierella massiliensis]|uniref:hypothetical protein n=1 Tax=Allofournierella massiliensis TaxID=1650663 RepID=UPI0025A3CC9E|nr:hypothetical protein [Fournierella massiliensis]
MKKQLLNVEKNRKNFLPVFRDKLREYCSLYNSRSHEMCRDGYGKTRAKSIFFEKKPDRARFLWYEKKKKRGAEKRGKGQNRYSRQERHAVPDRPKGGPPPGL